MFFIKKKKNLLTHEEENFKKFKDEELEKGDTFAMIIAALITLLPAVLLFLGVFYFIIWVLFLR
ncbi:MAG: hypothetical protein GX984_01400 [Erysipelothrix sp.]|nr:hypothetical protein [Erysipelothrix sp.]